MTYRIEQDAPRRPEFGGHDYSIFSGENLVARYWHDHRGDEHEIEFVGGRSEPWPVGRMTDFLEGGGPEPLRLSPRAIAYLDSKLA